MNIFNVLTEGKSRLYEPSISAMLGYLLDTKRDHGLGDRFFREFIKLLFIETRSIQLQALLASPFMYADVELEVPYIYENQRYDIDIEIIAYSKPDSQRIRIIIENKIRPGSARDEQLANYYKAIASDRSENEPVFIVFLTPEQSKSCFENEFAMLTVENNDFKSWLFWSNESNGIANLLIKILEMDLKGEIDPINEYLRHTLKAFVSHIRTRLKQYDGNGIKSIRSSSSDDIGEIVESVDIILHDGSNCRIIRRSSTQIQVFINGDKVVAKEILRNIIKERKLNIAIENTNTRSLGKRVLDEIRNSETV